MTGKLAAELRTTPENQHTELILKYSESVRPSLRFAAIDALEGRSGDKEAQTVEKAFEDNASIVRQRAIEVLSSINPERGLHLLLAGLQDEDQWIRQAAVQQILSVSLQFDSSRDKSTNLYRNAVPGLIRALNDPDDVVATGAMAALRKITGNSWYASMRAPLDQRRMVKAKWENWWKTAQSGWTIAPAYQKISPVRPSRSDPAPDFSLKDIEGKTLSLTSQKGRVTLLNFWGTWCPPCQVELPGLEKLSTNFGTRGLDTVGIALSEENGATSLRKFAEMNHLTYYQTLATDEVLNSFGDIHEVPVTFLIDKKGNVRYKWEGERDFATFRSAVERLLAEPQ